MLHCWEYRADAGYEWAGLSCYEYRNEVKNMDLQNKTVLVIGTGKSGIGAAGLLSKAGAKTILFDSNEKLNVEALGEDGRNCFLTACDRNASFRAGGTGGAAGSKPRCPD